MIEYSKSKHGSVTGKPTGDVDLDALSDNSPHMIGSNFILTDSSVGGLRADAVDQTVLLDKRSTITTYFRASLI